MTTADGMHPVFSGTHPKIFLIISDLYRVVTDIAEVHTYKFFEEQYTPFINARLGSVHNYR